jgi:CheY-like chemotaxis protein
MTTVRKARILIATDSASDAELVRKLLADEFDDVSVSTDPERSVEDFERRKPQVLVLAFNTLEKAERYYLGLYRRGTTAHALPHRTVILCNKDDLRRAYELCRDQYFDDYILFWPLTNDAPRLPMSVHHALRQLAPNRSAAASMAELAAQARRIAELEAQLEQYVARGGSRVDEASRTVRAAGQQIGAAIDTFGRRLTDGELRDLVEMKDRGGFESELGRFKKQQIEPPLQAVADAVAPLRQWADGLRDAFAPQLESARSVKALAEHLRPLVLVVDDDRFQHRLLSHMLADSWIDLEFAASGAEALSFLRRRRPDLVLMDIELPDMSGVEVVRRMKAVAQLAAVPVVMITGHSEKQLVIDSLKAGAAAFVVKPFDKATLLAKLTKLLDLPA